MFKHAKDELSFSYYLIPCGSKAGQMGSCTVRTTNCKPSAHTQAPPFLLLPTACLVLPWPCQGADHHRRLQPDCVEPATHPRTHTLLTYALTCRMFQWWCCCCCRRLMT